MSEENQDAFAGLESVRSKMGYIHGLHDSTNIHLNPSSSVQSHIVEGTPFTEGDYPEGYLLGWEEGRKQAREFLRLNATRRPQTRSG